ncbi:vesicle transport through interaction with t-SNAREs homolog 1A isoform X3 [Molossus molossus]|uniref:vesicle transport through interaction with t-SNAREs homolog 1A isoform X3 n=1 Tax=Molossus molossus TaxID=27622 RepID=UPI0017468B58|nr:vesicle transport through interaction with t-SNAREs homolog 1A isoform X3 [Molossus molossus]
MSSDFEGYEQDFAVLTAEITSKIARVPRLPPDEKKQMVANVEKQLEEAKELLEQMDLEVREIPPQSRGMYSNRMRSYKQEMGKLETDFKRSRIAYSDEVRNELLGDDGNSSENQRAHLLDNTERLERSSRRLEAGYQIAVETEQIGQEVLENLSHDREKIQRARERLRETDANLGKSSRVLTGMLRREVLPTSRGNCPVWTWGAGKVLQLTSNARVAKTAPVSDGWFLLAPCRKAGSWGQGREHGGGILCPLGQLLPSPSSPGRRGPW